MLKHMLKNEFYKRIIQKFTSGKHIHNTDHLNS